MLFVPSLAVSIFVDLDGQPCVYVYMSCIGVPMCAYWGYALSLTTVWTSGYAAVAASPPSGFWIWQPLAAGNHQ